MTLEANGAIPAYRKKPAVDAAGATGHAAGVLFVAPDGDVLLLRRSSKEANYSGHWALPGGGVEEGETPEIGADREVREEMGVEVSGGKKLLDQRRTPTGMIFHTFAQPVAKKFAPRLNEEHSGYAWAPLDQLPQPIHPAVAATLKERLGTAEDMTPEDWSGLRDGFLKWTVEEEREGEHVNQDQKSSFNLSGASDMALTTLAFDRDSVRMKDRDGRMRVSVANISKANVCPYRGSEIPGWQALGLDPNRIYNLLRDPKELEKAAPTFNEIQVLRKHIPVNAEDAQLWDVVGTTGSNARFEAPYLKNSLTLWTQEGIENVESEEQRELSSAYHYKPDMTPGTYEGEAYDGVMREICGNHVALVKDGRAGPDVVVGDSNEEIEKMNKAILARTISVNALMAYLAPRMQKPLIAMDSKPLGIMATIFDGVTGKTFKTKIPVMAKRTRDSLKGKLAQDATLEDVEKVLGMLEKHEIEGADESVSKEQHNAMEAAAHGASALDIPKAVGKEFSEADKGKTFDEAAFREHLKSKGMADDAIEETMGMMPKPAAGAADEEDEEAKKKREEEEKKKGAAAADEDKSKDDEKDKGKDMGKDKDMVTKPAMDAAIKAATAATEKRIRDEQRAILQAHNDVRPYVGELAMAFDSAEDVYREALSMLGVEEAKTIDKSALPTILKMQRKAGAQPIERSGSTIAMDADASKGFSDRWPEASRISSAN